MNREGYSTDMGIQNISGDGVQHIEAARSMGPIRAEHLALYMKDTDEQLYQRIRDIAAKLGHLPRKEDVPAFDYIKKRLGPWPRVLEQAGLKPVSEKRRTKQEDKEQLKHTKKRLKHKGRRQRCAKMDRKKSHCVLQAKNTKALEGYY